MRPTIREIKQSDYNNLAALSIQVWLHTYAKDGIRNTMSTFVLSRFAPEYFAEIHESEKQRLFVATVKDHLVGFVTIDLDSSCCEQLDYGYEVVTLYIQEYFQGKGIGTALLKYVTTLFGSKQWLTTWIHNAQAIEFYQHQSFKTVGHTYFDLDGEKHKNLILGKGVDETWNHN